MSDDHVNPGDLITAELWNRIVDKVQQVEDRLDQFVSEGGLGQIMISSTSPADNIRENDTLIIYGLNFGLATDAITILIGTRILKNDEIVWVQCTDQKLVVIVPQLGLTPGGPGTNMLITVRNRRSSDSVTRKFLPAPVVVSGEVFVDSLQTTALAVPTSGTLKVPFSVRSAANIAAQFDLHANVVGLTTTPRVVTSLTDSTELLRVLLDPSQTATCAVEVDIPNGSSGPFNVSLRAIAGGVRGTSGLLPFTVGATAPAPSTGVKMNFISATPAGTASFDWENQRIAVPAIGGSSVTFDFRCFISAAGGYTTQVNLFAPNMTDPIDDDWFVRLANGLRTPASAGDVDDFSYEVSAFVTNPRSGYVQVTVTGPGSGASVVRCFSIQSQV